ncbi:RIP metalloprotease RseP [Sediminibacter sp. Hel_I_10]|uniref:RIP metalloprotease RseP n=1 Tax=Sediminibacter sp. Hel_I_10 TaxID=1392490 RepID=UPI00047E8946|nr:RIP metalloprotease RseP [Sediminibacter sp. Hel_I_10]
MEFVIKISQFLLSLSLLIVLHELGHFIPAKLFKTRVEKFYLFFDVKFSLFKKKIGDTEYGIGWLPLGGYVKISGMIDESMDKEQMAQPPKPWEFRSKPAWQRLIIMLGGVTVNFILAYFIYVFLAFGYGDTTTKVSSLKDGYWIENQLLKDIGFQTGDKILKVNDLKVINDSDIRSNIIGAETITIQRNGVEKVITLPEDFLGQFSSAESRQLFERRIPFMIGAVADSSLNKTADVKPEDIIIAIEGQKLRYFDQADAIMDNYKNETLSVDLLRDNDTITRELKVDEKGNFGFYPGLDYKRFAEMGYYDIATQTYTFGESWAEGGRDFVETVTKYGVQLKAIFTPSTGAYKGVGGFKAIFDIFPPVWSWQAFWVLTAFLSIMLGVLNLLPIPALDGGHVMFLLYEMISGRAPSEKFLERAQLAGFIILIIMVLSANINDWI